MLEDGLGHPVILRAWQVAHICGKASILGNPGESDNLRRIWRVAAGKESSNGSNGGWRCNRM